MKSGRDNYLVCFAIIIYFHFITAQTTAFTYDDTDFAFFQTTPDINQPDAQTQCINWGGNLTTIKSAVEDSLLYYSIPDLSTAYTCHIGLNKIGGNDFVWIDGSTSSYRNWGTLITNFPLSNDGYDCVRHRYRSGGVTLSQGWLNAPCSFTRNCYFCSKPGTPSGCDLIYNSSCYKLFGVSTPINWLDAQSSCAIWGGDLTSITTERENNYLNTLITSSVGNCWIGLNDRDVEGMYTWIDGTSVSYTNWTSTPPNVANSDCVQINNAGNGMWESVSCDTSLDAFLCKRDSSSTIPTGARFGRITNGRLEFEELTGNTFLYDSQILVCGSDGSPVVWEYSQNSDLSVPTTTLTETSNYVGFSWLNVVNTMQGYYRCTIINSISYTVGVYDTTSTTVAVAGTSYTYVVGVDRTNVLLLCDPVVSGSLSMLIWSLQGSMYFNNPVNLNSESSNLPDVSTSLSCVRDGVTFLTTQICVKVPTIYISSSGVPVTSYSSVYPAMNTLSVPSTVQDITLSINIEGKWNHPDSSESTNSILTIPNFSSQNNGVYKFYINNWDDVEVCAIQITLTTITTITGDPDTQLTYSNTVFGYFNSSVINWHSAQLFCLDWGGNLATIKSAVEDSLLYYSIPDLSTAYTCHIGLNKIGGNDFVWIDGSTSSYRNWGTLITNFPLSNDGYDCVRHRYRSGGVTLSQGWLNSPCSRTKNCYFCSKPGTSNGCDLIFDSSCYKVFEVSTPINWLDAQSSCAIWGGNLTSITTERENNYLNTLINTSVGNSWIGLNDRDVEGMYTWIDRTSVSYTNWTSFMFDNSDSSCVQMNNTGDGYWYSVNCQETSNTFMCKRPSNFSTTDHFGQLVNGGLDFEVLQNGTILQGSLTLVCRGDGTSETQWIYSQNLDLSNNQEINATFNIQTGLSWLKVDDSKQGVYKCQINDTTSYMVGLYRQISEVVPSNTPLLFNYTVGSTQLLYYPDGDIKESIKWTPEEVQDGDTKQYNDEFPNPVEFSTVFSAIGAGVHTMTAYYRMSPVTLIGSVELSIKDTIEVTIRFANETFNASDVKNQLFPSAQEIEIPEGTEKVTLSCSESDCEWMIEIANSKIETVIENPYIITKITEDNEGTYSLIRNTPTGKEYLTARVYIYVKSSGTTTSSPSITIIAIAIIPIIIIIMICLIVIIIFIIICVQKKRTPPPFTKRSISAKEENPGYENSEIHSKEYIELQADPNPQYIIIDESSMIPLESENEQKQRECQNHTNSAPTYTSPYAEIPETQNTTTEPSELSEGYVSMSSVKQEKKFIPSLIPLKQFPATYQKYVASGIGKDSLFSVEFIKLTEVSKNAEFEIDEALKVENTTKNPFKNIVPFDENRVVLDSQYFDCNYINASYIHENQFIATIHPTKATHRDFLQMIYQTESSMVIMLTARKEKAKIIGGVSNRVCYWPKKDEMIECEPFVTTLINSTETTAFVKQEISLKNTLEGKEHSFTQCISPIWNEDSTVAEMALIVVLLSRILKQLQDDSSKPIIIHCEDGISKTGVILAGINSVKELTLKKTINIFNTVKNLRKQRMKMVPTLACYITCYSLMNEYCSIHL